MNPERYTPGELKLNWHDCGEYTADLQGRDSDHPDDPQWIRTVAVVCRYAGADENKANARLLRAAWESYRRNCGTEAVRLAEADLLGKSMEALRRLKDTMDDPCECEHGFICAHCTAISEADELLAKIQQ